MASRGNGTAKRWTHGNAAAMRPVAMASQSRGSAAEQGQRSDSHRGGDWRTV